MKNKNARLLAAGGVSDHIHLYASLPSTLSLAEFVNAVKSNSSRWIHQTYRDARGFAWQEGYGAFSVSKSAEKRVISYVRNQEEHHLKHSFQEEFLKLLEKHKIGYDERYLWG
jgi:REP element-mobilizing transposase RayT